MSQLLEQPPIQFIPESAPFNSEQRAWLNGFFAGWLGMQAHAPPAALPLTEAPRSREPEEESFPWHDPALPLAERLELAKEKPLPRRLMAAMAQLDCGACGYLCQTYAERLAAGEEACLTLCSPGGKETSKALKQLLKSGSEPAARSDRLQPVANDEQSGSSGTRQNPCPATVLRTVNLNAPGSGKHTTHVELELGDSGLSYEPGDSLGVWPTNCPDLVAQLLDRIAASGDEEVTLSGETFSFREALDSKCCLAEITEELLACLADFANEEESHALRSLIEDDGPIHGCDVLDLLRLFPSAQPAPSELVAALSPLRPRLYSISSALRAHPGEVHLTVGRVAWEHNGRTRKGVCSTQFADRLGAGHSVPVFVQKSHGFALPADSTTSIIMVGPGTGIAPFRAFLEERAATGATGKNWLFFGDRHGATDFLYREELEAWQGVGLLTRLDLAFSRDGDAKIYVQDRMREHAAELWRWLQEGAYFYVCGDAKRMAADVDRALRETVAAAGGLSSEAAKEYVARLAAEGRYCRDVY